MKMTYIFRKPVEGSDNKEESNKITIMPDVSTYSFHY